MLHYVNRLRINAINKKLEKFIVTFTMLSFISENRLFFFYFLNYNIIKKFVKEVIYYNI
jgi:hypothetical protein